MSAKKTKHVLSSKFKITVLIVAVVLATAHIFWPCLKIDNTIIALFVIALVPWLVPYLKSFEAPGVGKFEFHHKLENLSNEAKEAGLLEDPPASAEIAEYSFEAAFEYDSYNGLQGLRFEILLRIAKLSTANNLNYGTLTDGDTRDEVLKDLRKNKILTLQQCAVLTKILDTLDVAIDGASAEHVGSFWVLEVGPKLLGTLDTFLGEVST